MYKDGGDIEVIAQRWLERTNASGVADIEYMKDHASVNELQGILFGLGAR
jgi:hypothetical protein